MLLLVVCALSFAATPAQIDDVRAKGLAWLLLNQNGDGSWGDSAGTEIRSTSYALDALLTSGTRGYAYSHGLGYITNAEALSVDSLARQIKQLQVAGLDWVGVVNKLLAWRNNQVSWGAYDHYQTSYPDTSLALEVFINNNSLYPPLENDILLSVSCKMLPSQRSGDATVAGSWSFVGASADEPSGNTRGYISPTVYNVLRLDELKKLRNKTSVTCTSSDTTYTLQTAIDDGINWVLTQRRHADGGYGDDGTSQIFDTALVHETLVELYGENDPNAVAALDYLLSQQDPQTGAWQDDAALTAFVLNSLPYKPLADQDKDGIPDVVEPIVGTDATVADSRDLLKGNGKSVIGVTAPIEIAVIAGQSNSTVLTVIGGTGPYTYEIIGGELPTGLSLNPVTGEITGAATSGGDYSFTYKVTDANGLSTTAVATISVTGAFINFANSFYEINENGGSVAVTLSRNDSSTAASVDYALGSGTAVDSIDYTNTTGTLNFAIGQDTATFSVSIVDDLVEDGPKHVPLC